MTPFQQESMMANQLPVDAMYYVEASKDYNHAFSTSMKMKKAKRKDIWCMMYWK